MNIVGKPVKHPVFGTGIISSIQEDKMIVKFCGTINREIMFQYPYSFLGKTPYLTSEDADVYKCVRKRANEICKCDFCNKIVESPELIDKNHLCPDCAKYATTCYECGKLVDSRSKAYDEYYVCEECFRKLFFRCSICEEYYRRDGMLVSGSFIPSDELWCKDCAAEKGFHTCDDCGVYYHIEQLNKVGDYAYYCSSCLGNHARKCTECGEYFVFTYIGENATICGDCSRKMNYREAISKIDFSKLKVEKISAYDLARTRTVPLMTRLHRSKEYLKLYGAEVEYMDALLIYSWYESDALVVVYKDPFPMSKVPQHYSSATMTEFKREDMEWWMFREKHEVIATLKWSDEYDFDLWKNPFLLYAQTDFDTDYRKEWEGGELVYEGNNYGDTSDFYIIGVIRKKENK